jgi:hypothetical protein
MTENKPIIRLMFVNMKETFNDLSDEEKMAFMVKDRKNLEELGCTFEMVNLTGSNEEWQYIGIEEWPSMDAVEKRAKFEKEELDIQRYVEYKTIVGTRESSDDYGKE